MNNLAKKQEFLNKLSTILTAQISPINTEFAVDKLFKQYLNTEKVQFLIWDKNLNSLKEFTQTWNFSEDSKITEEVTDKYENLVNKKGKIFYFNSCICGCELSEIDIKTINKNINTKNSIVFPFIANGEIFGLMNLTATNTKFEKEYFDLLNIATKFISLAIINYNLTEQMEVNLNYYKAMKDIAKIIESQYELSYIIPLIGEMIDRFMNAHLIYIFINKDNKYELVWPSACKDKNIYKMLENIDLKTEYLLSENKSTGAFPLKSEDKILGAIVAYSNIDKLYQQEIEYLVQLTKQSGTTIQRANMYAEVLKHATMDALTGLNNRRQLEIRLNQEVANSLRNNIPLCCMMLDVDYFKKVNDTYGHAAGDSVLKNVSDIIKKEIREYDIACRYGGEEFLIILPQTNSKESILVAQRLRKVIENSETKVKQANSTVTKTLKVTVSIGVCAFDKSLSAQEFIQNADKALYEAKENGRNRVIFF